MVLLIDNYDSFSYNLYQYIGSILNDSSDNVQRSFRSSSHPLTDTDIKVVRNDEITVCDIVKMNPGRIVISPGPGKPSEAGICVEMIKELYTQFPILGICLGHQAMFEAFGGTVSYASKLMHGKSSEITVDTENPLFKSLPATIKAARYHSLAAVESTIPPQLAITARTVAENEIMALCHKEYPVYGVQFHPESILTPDGKTIIFNFLSV
ncbi:MAG: aminodeoxychorismate/anthranilate synthase component II [Chitinispirillales bacterium]|jgi:anthranilate synthase component 2|nr:aminodeoxychorismate/anthranilate synthase component II [Chitinispirillales bacterium]